MNAGPGDLVVCVDNHGARELREGRVYTVSLVNTYPAGLGYDLAKQRPLDGWLDFKAERFRKLNDEPDDMAVIRRIKSCKPVKVPAELARAGEA